MNVGGQQGDPKIRLILAEAAAIPKVLQPHDPLGPQERRQHVGNKETAVVRAALAETKDDFAEQRPTLGAVRCDN